MLLSQAKLCSSPAYLGGLSKNSVYEALVLGHFPLYHSQSKSEATSVSRNLPGPRDLSQFPRQFTKAGTDEEAEGQRGKGWTQVVKWVLPFPQGHMYLGPQDT